MDVASLLAAAKDARAGNGSVDAIFAAAKSGASGQGSEEALLKAARTGDAEHVKVILRSPAGLNLNCRGSWDGMTALHWAVEKGHMEVVQALVAAGADVDAKDSSHWTPLMVAVTKNWHTGARALISLGADLAPKLRGRTVDWAAHALDAEMRAILCSDGKAPALAGGAPSRSRESDGNVGMGRRAHGPDSPPSSRTRAASRKRAAR